MNRIAVVTLPSGSCRIAVTADAKNVATARRIPDVRFDTSRGVWHTDATRSNILQTATLLPGFDRSEKFEQLHATALRDMRAEAEERKLDESQPEARKFDSWRHQAQAYNFARKQPAAMLNMYMGTGKSKVVVDLLANFMSDNGVAVIVAPMAVLPVWREQIERWSPREFDVTILDGKYSGKQKGAAVAAARSCNSARVFVINYESVYRPEFMKELRKYKELDFFICDESHKIKANMGIASRACWQLGKLAKRRLALTGTPMAHSPLDVWAQYRFLDINIFGNSFMRFKSRYAVMNEYTQYEKIESYVHQDEMAALMSTAMFKLDTNEVLDLPEAVHTNRYVELEPAALSAYRRLEKELITEWNGGVITASNALVKMLRLQQITGGELPLDDGTSSRISTAKRRGLEEVLDDLEPHEPVVVFAQFKAELADIREAALNEGRAYFELSGSRKELAAWQADNSGSVLGVQVQSGSEGVSMTRARYCVYYSTGYSLGRYEQSTSRIHRPGQVRNVLYIHLLATGTIDEKVQRALAERKDTVAAILSQ